MEEKKLRFWENWVVLAGVALFARNYLVSLTKRFNDDIDILAGNGVPAPLINTYLEEYNHFWNSLFPVCLMALAVYVAWWVFHHYAFPLLREKPSYAIGVSYLFFTITLIFTGYYIHQHLREYWELTGHHELFPHGFHFFQRTRKITLLSNSIVYLWLIFLYEACSQGFYAFCRKLRQEGPMYSLIINFLFAFCLLVFLVLLGILGYARYDMRTLNDFFYILILCVAVIYGQDYFYRNLLLNRGKKRLASGIFMVVGLCFFSVLTIEILNTGFRYPYESVIYRWVTNLPEISLITLVTGIVALIAGTLRYLVYWQKNKLQTQVTVKSAELDQLKAQVNPHFLFNALNTLYSVALKEKAETTASGIQKLGDMMRFMLNENNHDQISIYREVEQLENYIEIQRMRIEETPDIRITVNLQRPETEIRIAPMLLNPFVENAFKHGISLVNPSWIHITLTFDKENLYFKVHNSLHPSREPDPEKFNNGIGLENVKRRLNLLYPLRHRLVIEQSEQDFFIALTLQY